MNAFNLWTPQTKASCKEFNFFLFLALNQMNCYYFTITLTFLAYFKLARLYFWSYDRNNITEPFRHSHALSCLNFFL